jgi:two-component system, cell cycle sensor histidine kinase and response regulator CckA
MTSDLRKKRKKWNEFLLKLTPARIALLYAAAGCLWIAFSDMALSAFVHDVSLITMIAMIKGWLYVAVTAIILYLLIRRGEANLRESEKKFRILADTAAAAIFIYGDTTFLSVNATSQKMTGYSQEELLRINILDVVHPDHRAMVRQRAAARLRGDDVPSRYGFKIVTKFGEERWVDFTAGVINLDGRRAAVGTAYDVTERKQLEDQLRQSQKIEAVGLLAAGIAHDFNNILTAIIGYGHIIQMKLQENDPLRSYAEQILTSAERAANLTSGLLAFSRKQVIHPHPVSVDEIITRVGRLLARLIGEDIELNLKLGCGETAILADPGQLELVLMNLATNAQDAMPDGGALTITTGRVELDREFIETHGFGVAGSYALITATDTGVGMDQTTQDRIFEPFFTTKEVGKGTGLGLAVVYGIIKQHGGHITVHSEPGKGTTYKIYLPIINATIEKPRPLKTTDAWGGSETILVAEDDESVRVLTVKLLTEAGYRVIEASDGEEAVRKYKEQKDAIQLLVLDVVMPRKNGKEAYDEICEIRPEIKTIFMSGYAGDVFERKHIDGESFNIIMKPVSPLSLLHKVREVLDA